MSDSPTYHSQRGDDPLPRTYQNTATLVKGFNLPRTYGQLVGEPVKPNLFVFAKEGTSLNFYEDSKGEKMVGPSGGKGGQSGNPARANTEYVGTTTGRYDQNFIEVTWVNTWWQNNELVKGSGINPVSFVQSIVGAIKGGERKSETKTSWVKRLSVDVSSTSPDDKANGLTDQTNYDDTTPPPTNSGGGIDTTTLGYAAVAAALVLGTKKKKRR